jgi:adenosylhomocysteinase
VYDVPAGIDDRVARLKLAALGITLDTLTGEQKKYLESWDIGT